MLPAKWKHGLPFDLSHSLTFLSLVDSLNVIGGGELFQGISRVHHAPPMYIAMWSPLAPPA